LTTPFITRRYSDIPQSLLVVYYQAAEKPFFKTRRVRGEYFSHARAL
jgi:hypothetical protein